jgi:hypothetical protein
LAKPILAKAQFRGISVRADLVSVNSTRLPAIASMATGNSLACRGVKQMSALQIESQNDLCTRSGANVRPYACGNRMTGHCRENQCVRTERFDNLDDSRHIDLLRKRCVLCDVDILRAYAENELARASSYRLG